MGAAETDRSYGLHPYVILNIAQFPILNLPILRC